MLAMSWPFGQTPVPTVDDLEPEIGHCQAVDVIAALTDECSAGRLSCYLDQGQWMVQLPAAVAPGGGTVSLKVWAVTTYPGLRLENYDHDRMTETAMAAGPLNTPSTDAWREATPDFAGVEDDWIPSASDFLRVSTGVIAQKAHSTFLDELAADCLWPYRVHGEWNVWVVDGRRMTLGDWIRYEYVALSDVPSSGDHD